MLSMMNGAGARLTRFDVSNNFSAMPAVGHECLVSGIAALSNLRTLVLDRNDISNSTFIGILNALCSPLQELSVDGNALTSEGHAALTTTASFVETCLPTLERFSANLSVASANKESW